LVIPFMFRKYEYDQKCSRVVVEKQLYF
jgi:hypothetical protein